MSLHPNFQRRPLAPNVPDMGSKGVVLPRLVRHDERKRMEAAFTKPRLQKMTKYTQRQDNEGFEVPNGEVYKLACCDCGLVHQIVIIAPGIKKGTPLGMAAKRDNRATAARRRAKPNVPSVP